MLSSFLCGQPVLSFHTAVYQRKLRRPSHWTFSSPGSPLSSNSTIPSPHPYPPPPVPNPPCPTHKPYLIIPWFGQNGKWNFGHWRAAHYCITTEPPKELCWLYNGRRRRRTCLLHVGTDTQTTVEVGRWKAIKNRLWPARCPCMYSRAAGTAGRRIRAATRTTRSGGR